MLRTHLAIGVLAILLFLPSISNKIVFIIVALIATYLPDIDTGFSRVGRSAPGLLVSFFTRHRGALHSFSFIILISLLFAWFIPILALPFFLGYALHLFADSFTKEGITPFWPMKYESKGHFRTGGLRENILFFSILIIDIIVGVVTFKNIFSV